MVLIKIVFLASHPALARTSKLMIRKQLMPSQGYFPISKPPQSMGAVRLVSDQRGIAAHGVRPPAENFPAFSQFTKDLSLCLEAMKELQVILERDFRVNGDEVYIRHEAKKWLPHINRPPKANYSIVQVSQMMGKTVEKVDFGFRKEIEGVHESEALIIYFTDGSIISLEAGSNVGNLAGDENGLRPEDFHVDFA